MLTRTPNFVHLKSHVYWPGIYPGSVQHWADHYLPEPWHGLNLLDASV